MRTTEEVLCDKILDYPPVTCSQPVCVPELGYLSALVGLSAVDELLKERRKERRLYYG
jgi:hypothetical protein